MKLISPSGQIIDVPEAHAATLIGQKVWKEYKEIKDALQVEETKQDETKPHEEVVKKVRRTKQ